MPEALEELNGRVSLYLPEEKKTPSRILVTSTCLRLSKCHVACHLKGSREASSWCPYSKDKMQVSGHAGGIPHSPCCLILLHRTSSALGTSWSPPTVLQVSSHVHFQIIELLCRILVLLRLETVRHVHIQCVLKGFSPS